MSRKYADRIVVHCCPQALLPGAADAAPQRFTWRRRRYRVLAVLQRWVEVAPWWRAANSVDEEYEMWRVEAAAERSAPGAAGHFDLCRHCGSDSWFMVRAFD